MKEILIKSQVISPDVINGQFISLSKVIQDLAKEALLARVEFSMCGEILNYETIINQIRRNALKGIDPQNDLAPSPPNRNLNSIFRDELNLSTIDPPIIEYKGLWKTLRLRIKTCMVLSLMLIALPLGDSRDRLYCNKSGIKHHLVLD